MEHYSFYIGSAYGFASIILAVLFISSLLRLKRKKNQLRDYEKELSRET